MDSIIFQSPEYELVQRFYHGKTAQRSDLPYNHINEGLEILDRINARYFSKLAYCLHPLLQDNNDLAANYHRNCYAGIDAKSIILAMEYRAVANRYLSTDNFEVHEIKLGPLPEIREMLIADKVQNRKDFERFHKGTHPRSKELEEYFRKWMERFPIYEDEYQKLISGL